MRFIQWVKDHILVCIIVLVVVFGVFKYFIPSSARYNSFSSPAMMGGSDASFEYDKSTSSLAVGRAANLIMPPVPEVAPVPGANRLVVQNSYLSLLVKNVVETRDSIISRVTSLGGYMVSSSTSNPQDAGSVSLTVRVPSSSLDETLSFLRNQAVKVVSEELQGTDVTDEFVDIETRINQLELTKAKMNELLDAATEVSDLININSQILSIQAQIDSLKGQQQSLSQNADLTKVTVYLSTDELALPYAPSQPFRPEVIIKLAIRSLVGHLQEVAGFLIWVGVYSVVWLPLLIIGIVLYKLLRRKKLL